MHLAQELPMGPSHWAPRVEAASERQRRKRGFAADRRDAALPTNQSAAFSSTSGDNVAKVGRKIFAFYIHLNGKRDDFILSDAAAA